MNTETGLRSISDKPNSKYIGLLNLVAPKAIETDSEYERAQKDLTLLIDRGESRTPEETALMRLMVCLIGAYDARERVLPVSGPADCLQYLLNQHNLKAIDIADLLGGRPKASEILSGRRSISKEQAKKLGERFNVSPAVFI